MSIAVNMNGETTFHINIPSHPKVSNNTWTIKISPPKPNNGPTIIEKIMRISIYTLLLIIFFAIVKYFGYVVAAFFAGMLMYYSVCEFIFR